MVLEYLQRRIPQPEDEEPPMRTPNLRQKRGSPGQDSSGYWKATQQVSSSEDLESDRRTLCTRRRVPATPCREGQLLAHVPSMRWPLGETGSHIVQLNSGGRDQVQQGRQLSELPASATKQTRFASAQGHREQDFYEPLHAAAPDATFAQEGERPQVSDSLVGVNPSQRSKTPSRASEAQPLKTAVIEVFELSMDSADQEEDAEMSFQEIARLNAEVREDEFAQAMGDDYEFATALEREQFFDQ